VDALAGEAFRILGLRKRTDADHPRKAVESVAVRVKGAMTDRLLQDLYSAPSKAVARRNLKDLGNSLGISLKESDPAAASQVATFAEENAALIRSLGEDVITEVADAVTKAQEEGLTAEGLASYLQERFGVVKSRATLIANDQVLKLNGRLTEARQAQAGIRQYTWSTAGDGRVRPEHAARNGQVFSWNDPPPDGHPGTPVLCRCSAIPVFPGEET